MLISISVENIIGKSNSWVVYTEVVFFKLLKLADDNNRKIVTPICYETKSEKWVDRMGNGQREGQRTQMSMHFC